MEQSNAADGARLRVARLAADRTAMANDRTRMAYERTSLGLLLVGLGAAFHLPGLALPGTGLMAVAVAVMGLGWWRHAVVARRIAGIRAVIDRIAGGAP